MKIFYTLFLSICILILSGCTPKLTVKSLHPSLIPNEKINSLFIEQFNSDNINQTEAIENKLSNTIIKQKKVFVLKTNEENVDAIIKGKVLESSLNYDVYYKKDLNRQRCRIYEYDKNNKVKRCIQYYNRYIPCENRYYKVSTKIELLDSNEEEILFSKIYTKTREINKCYDEYYYTFPRFTRDKKEINSQLAEDIAYEIQRDISPHYKYFELEIIEEFDDNKNITKEQKSTLSNIAQLIEDNNINTAQSLLKELNFELANKSWEVLYNLALTYEAVFNLSNANLLYKQASKLTSNTKNLALINNAINRTKRNLEEKIKAKSQLP